MTLSIFPKVQAREQIEEIINNSTGREIELFYVYSTYACPNPDDSLDPITNTSTNSFCAVCSGTYWIDVYSGVTMSAHVTWKFDYKNEFETGGRIFIGDAQAKVMHSPEREQLVKEAKYLVVDGKTMDTVKTTMLGNPINRMVISLKERGEE